MRKVNKIILREVKFNPCEVRSVKSRFRHVRFNPHEMRFTNHLGDCSLLETICWLHRFSLLLGSQCGLKFEKMSWRLKGRFPFSGYHNVLNRLFKNIQMVCLHVTFFIPCPLLPPLKFSIVPISITDKMGDGPILAEKNVTCKRL